MGIDEVKQITDIFDKIYFTNNNSNKKNVIFIQLL